VRAVVDTNVFVSAILSRNSPPGRVLDAWEDREFQIVISDELFVELERVMSRPRIIRRVQKPSSHIAEFLSMIRTRAEVVRPQERLDVVQQDPSDNRVLGAAVEGQADYIVSGDQHLLALGSFEGIEIVSPARFAAILAATSSS
jgi:putative PIN family toxin of toxin-antitoxin system